MGTPYDLLTRIRLKHAIKLIRETEAQLSEISENCGFSAVRNLKNNLADKTGLTIKEIRAMPDQEYLKLMTNITGKQGTPNEGVPNRYKSF